jgi:hypothetical protein
MAPGNCGFRFESDEGVATDAPGWTGSKDLRQPSARCPRFPLHTYSTCSPPPAPWRHIRARHPIGGPRCEGADCRSDHDVEYSKYVGIDLVSDVGQASFVHHGRYSSRGDIYRSVSTYPQANDLERSGWSRGRKGNTRIRIPISEATRTPLHSTQTEQKQRVRSCGVEALHCGGSGCVSERGRCRSHRLRARHRGL